MCLIVAAPVTDSTLLEFSCFECGESLGSSVESLADGVGLMLAESHVCRNSRLGRVS